MIFLTRSGAFLFFFSGAALISTGCLKYSISWPAISAGVITKSTRPVSMALAGMPVCRADAGS